MNVTIWKNEQSYASNVHFIAKRLTMFRGNLPSQEWLFFFIQKMISMLVQLLFKKIFFSLKYRNFSNAVHEKVMIIKTT